MAHEPSSAGRPSYVRRCVLLVCLAGLAIVGALTPPFHWSSALMVALTGLAALALAFAPSATVRFIPADRPYGGGAPAAASLPTLDQPGEPSGGVSSREPSAESGAAESTSAGDPPDSIRRAALRRGVVVWSTLLVAVLAWQAYAYVRQPDRSIAHHDYPTLSTLVDPFLEQGPLRLAGWLAWLAAGWWLVRR